MSANLTLKAWDDIDGDTFGTTARTGVASITTGDPFITEQVLSGSVSDDFWYGFFFKATGSGNVVTDLGRIFITGNSSAQTVYLYDCGTSWSNPVTPVSLVTSVSVPASGTNDQYTYASITPQTLTSSNFYVIVTPVTATAVGHGFATVQTTNGNVTLSMGTAAGGSAYSLNSGSTFTFNDNDGNGNVAYGTVNFKSYD